MTGASKVLAVPSVLLPVFPGTNGEYDMARAFEKAGGSIRHLVFRNRNPSEIAASFEEFKAAIGESQIIAFSGGYSLGSGKFITAVLRHPAIAGAITEFLEKQDGLILGICDGFQALVKSGLLPYGRLGPAGGSPALDSSASPIAPPAFGDNAIGRHVSRMVQTRVMPSNTPWLSLDEVGSIHTVPVSHSQGRLVISRVEAESLFASGQVPFCYADAAGNPATGEPDNPSGSAFAIEALSSPDGRILGKMSHPERSGDFVHINIPGNKTPRIFEAALRYFKG